MRWMVVILALAMAGCAAGQSAEEAAARDLLLQELTWVKIAQDDFFGATRRYAGTFDALQANPLSVYALGAASHDPQVEIWVRARGDEGWAARATHKLHPDLTCVVFDGIADIIPLPDGTIPQERAAPVCTD